MQGTLLLPVLLYSHYAIDAPRSPDDYSYQGGYIIAKDNAYKVCDAYVSQDCVSQQGQDQCVISTMNAMRQSGGQPGLLGVKIGVPIILFLSKPLLQGQASLRLG